MEVTAMVVTMLEANVPQERQGDLRSAFDGSGEALPPPIRESFLLRGDGEACRIVTVWTSREALDEYRASVETPGGVLMFRSVGAEPTLTIFDVMSRVTQTG
jgi:hypothetical protein